jgi:hypothetical protein
MTDTDLEAAWGEAFDALPAGWAVGATMPRCGVWDGVASRSS